MTATINEAQTKRIAHLVVLTVLIDAIGFGVVIPVLPEIVLKLTGGTLADATRIGGWLALAYAGVQFLSGPLVGNLGDRFGRRPVLLCALAGFAIDYLLTGFAPTIGWLFLGRALAGLFGASFGPAGAALADISAPEERARYFGMIGAAFGIGFVIGPAIGGLLGELGPRAPFHAAAALAAVNFALALAFFPETLPPERRRRFDWRAANPLGAILSLRGVPGVLPLALIGFFWAFAHMVYPTTWAFFTIARFGWTPGMIGVSLAVVGACMAAVQMLLVGRTVARFGERRTALLGMGIAAIAFLAYTLVTASWMVWPILIVESLQALAMPALSGMMSRRVPGDRQGELQGFNGSVQALASIVAPITMNPLLAHFTEPGADTQFAGAAFVLAAASAAVALVMLVRLPRTAKQT